MLIQRLQPPLRAAITAIGRSNTAPTQTCLNEAFAALSVCSRSRTRVVDQGMRVGCVRYASHKAQGAVNKAKDGPGKRLGAKKSGEQYVIPGNIIFRQRGTHWFPGDNCAMGRDHTIYSTEHGYVKYYKDPEKHPKRQYIGVVFERDMVLPLPRNAVRRRRLGMTAERMEIHTSALTPATTTSTLSADSPDPNTVTPPEVTSPILAAHVAGVKVSNDKIRKAQSQRNLTLRPGYMFRESNWEIGRAAERSKVKVRAYKPRDRWMAWKKSAARKAASAETRGLLQKGKGKKK